MTDSTEAPTEANAEANPKQKDEQHWCENLIMPLEGPKIRPCGKRAVKFVKGKWRCRDHARRAGRGKS